MKVPYTWLSEFVDLKGLSAEEIAEALSLRSVETTVETFGINLDGVVFGKVVEVKKHPSEENYRVVRVQVQEHTFIQVVTADSTVSVGDGVLVALPHSRVGDRCITKREVKGVLSEGVLLSAQDLGLEEKSEGVLKIKEKVKPGTDGAELLGFGEKILEIDITPNRGDMLSVRGVARDVAAIFGLEKKTPEEKALSPIGDFPIEIRDSDCKRYRGVVIEGVKVGESPLFIKKRLWQCGIKTINNVVDVTNYVMLRDGQPLHAFDLDRLEGGIFVRSARRGEKILALDGNEYELDEEVLVIADSSRPVAIAGVIGGLETGVTENTTRVLLESAYFDPFRVRKAARKLGLQTESSYRFERNTDIERVDRAQDYATELILSLSGGEVKVVKDLYPEPYKPARIFLPQGKYIKYAGEPYRNDEVKRILTALEIPCEIMRCGLEVFVPSHRSFDIKRDVDVIEEIMRIKGYESYAPEVLKLPVSGKLWKDYLLETKKFLRDRGLYEVLTYSFEDDRLYKLLELPLPELEVVNPLNPSQRYMRSSLIPSLLRVSLFNDRNYNYDQAFYEVGKVFGVGESWRLGILVKGLRKKFPRQEWTPRDVLELILDLFRLFGKEAELRTSEIPFLHPYAQAEILLDGKRVGFLGKLHPEKAQALEIKGEPVLAELELEKIIAEEILPGYGSFSRFPPVIRDLALVVDRDLSVDKLLNEIKSQAGELLEDLWVFDLYTGEKVGEGKKSVAVRLVFRSREGSLKDEQVNELVERILEALRSRLGAELRG